MCLTLLMHGAVMNEVQAFCFYTRRKDAVQRRILILLGCDARVTTGFSFICGTDCRQMVILYYVRKFSKECSHVKL